MALELHSAQSGPWGFAIDEDVWDDFSGHDSNTQ